MSCMILKQLCVIMGWSLDLFMTDWHWCFLTLFMLLSSTLHQFSSIDIVNPLGVGRDASFLAHEGSR